MWTFEAKYFDFRRNDEVTEEIEINSTVMAMTEAEIWQAAIEQALSRQEGRSFVGIELISC